MSDRIAVMNRGRVEQVGRGRAGLRAAGDRVRRELHGRLELLLARASSEASRGDVVARALEGGGSVRCRSTGAAPGRARTSGSSCGRRSSTCARRDLSAHGVPIVAGDRRGPRLPGRLAPCGSCATPSDERFVGLRAEREAVRGVVEVRSPAARAVPLLERPTHAVHDPGAEAAPMSARRRRRPIRPRPPTRWSCRPGRSLGVFFLLPLGILFVISFGQRGDLRRAASRSRTSGPTSPRASSSRNYARSLAPDLPPDLLAVDLDGRRDDCRSACAVSYPVAYYIAVVAPPRRRNLLLGLVVVPFWTSFLIRTYAWMFLLRTEGLSTALLIAAGLISHPLELLYNNFAVLIGLVYGELPFMILPLYASLEKLDLSLLEAAADLGAAARGDLPPRDGPADHAGDRGGHRSSSSSRASASSSSPTCSAARRRSSRAT